MSKENLFKIVIFGLVAYGCIVTYLFVYSSKIENQIYLPTFGYTDLKEYGYKYITVSGTLTGADGTMIANQLNASKFACDGSAKECRLTQAELFDGKSLTMYTETFPIKSWDENFIVFQTAPDSSQCVIWTYRIDRVKKELIGVRERAKKSDSELCSGIGIEKFEVKLVNGMDVISQLKAAGN